MAGIYRSKALNRSGTRLFIINLYNMRNTLRSEGETMPTVHFPYERSSLKPAARILLSEIDGDTPFIQQPVRMAS